MKPTSAILTEARHDLADLVAIASVSARGENLDSCAAAVASLLQDADFATEIHAAQVGPFVVGEAGSGPFTLIIYNHYDVQPEEPLDLWTDAPFTLTEREGRLYGRGAADDKGEFVSRLAGWRLFRENHPEQLPFRVIWIVEGEEEIGSPSLDGFLKKRFAGERADICWWEFGEIDSDGRPVVLMGFKGVLALELRCRTGKADLHSSLGAIFDNPLWRLAAALASMRDETGRILIDGFYETVRTPATIRELADKPPFTLHSMKAATGAERVLAGVDTENFFGHLNFEPCLNINGFHGGYGGEGSKTVLPSEGRAIVDFRLVPDQIPMEVADLVRRHLDAKGFSDIELNIIDANVLPVRSDPDHWAVREGCQLLEKWFGKAPVLQPSSPASGLAHPFVHSFGATLFGAGLTHHGAMLHSPDENIIVSQFEAMIGFSADFFLALSQKLSQGHPGPEIEKST